MRYEIQNYGGAVIILSVGFGILVVWLEKLLTSETFAEIGTKIAKHGTFLGVTDGIVTIVGVPLLTFIFIKAIIDCWKK